MPNTLTPEFHQRLSDFAEEMSTLTGQDICVAVGTGEGEAMTAMGGDFVRPNNEHCFCGMTYALSLSLLASDNRAKT